MAMFQGATSSYSNVAVSMVVEYVTVQSTVSLEDDNSSLDSSVAIARVELDPIVIA
jgi:hypothetical protein